MATQLPSIIQNENLHIPRGKGIEGAKTVLLKPKKKDHRERKALADLSKPAKPVASAVRKGSSLKEKSSLRGSETTKKAPKSSLLTDGQTTKCHKWEEEEIEKCYFTGNDLWEIEREAFEKRVQEEVDMVMSSMSKWNQDLYNCITPVKDVAEDIEDIKIIDLVPEPDLPLRVTSLLPTSGIDEDEDPFLEEPQIFMWPLLEPKY